MKRKLSLIIISILVCVSSCTSSTEPENSKLKFLWSQFFGNALTAGITNDDEYLYFQLSSYNNKLMKIKKDGTGLEEYEYSAGTVFGVPVVDSKYVYAGNLFGTVDVFHKDSLNLIWSKQGLQWTSIVSIDEARAFCTGENEVYGLDKFTGSEIWKTEVFGKSIYNSVIDGDRLYLATGSIHRQDGYLYCLNKYDGSIIFKNTLPYMESRSQFGGSSAGVEVWNNYVYIPSDNRNIYCFNKTDGSLVWEFLADSPMITPPRVSDGILYTGSLNRTCYALDALTGTLKWSYQTVGSINRDQPQFYKNYVMFMSGAMLIFDKSSGNLIADISPRTGDKYGYWVGFWDKDGKIYTGGFEESSQNHILLAFQFE